MVAEPTTATYSDDALETVIESHPVPDLRGVAPWQWDYSTAPPTQEANEQWIPTYDLNAAAAVIWDEKAASAAQDYSYSADGGSFSRNQVFDQFSRMASKYRSRSVPRGIEFIRTQREVTPEGYVVETTPLVDRVPYDIAFNQ
jgi:hypothetical protein